MRRRTVVRSISSPSPLLCAVGEGAEAGAGEGAALAVLWLSADSAEDAEERPLAHACDVERPRDAGRPAASSPAGPGASGLGAADGLAAALASGAAFACSGLLGGGAIEEE